ncbi:CPBP family intramembrane glutamic endopeptidase [Spirochaeta africana]|nr:CPBP family intramembrane glutamic endopeptidase [Spirochaeta africana]
MDTENITESGVEDAYSQPRARTALGAAAAAVATHVGLLLAGGLVYGVLVYNQAAVVTTGSLAGVLGGLLTAVLGVIAAMIAVARWGDGVSGTLMLLSRAHSLREYRHTVFFALLTYFLSVLFAVAINALPFMPDAYPAEELLALFPEPLLLRILLVGLLIPVVEEVIYRGIVLRRLAAIFSPRAAIVLSALVFGAIHWDSLQSLYTFAMGLAIGWLFLRTGSLQLAVLVHVVFNLYGVMMDALQMDTRADWVIGLYTVIFLLGTLILGSRACRFFYDYPEESVAGG